MCHEAALETTLKKKQVYQPTTNTSLVCDWARSLPPLSYPDVWRFLPPSPPQAVEAGREGPGRRSAHQWTGAGAGGHGGRRKWDGRAGGRKRNVTAESWGRFRFGRAAHRRAPPTHRHPFRRWGAGNGGEEAKEKTAAPASY